MSACHVNGCTRPRVKGGGHRYCTQHAVQRKREALARKQAAKLTPCMHQDCTAPKVPGRGNRFCQAHAALRWWRAKVRELETQRAEALAIVRALDALSSEGA